MNQMVPVDSLHFNEALYPRQKHSEYHVQEFAALLEGDMPLPPILVDKKTRTIVDGVHRWMAHGRVGRKLIDVEFKTYANDADLFKDATERNSAHGLILSQYDRLKVLEVSTRLGLKELDQAMMLRISLSQLRAIKPRYATVVEAVEGVTQLRKVPLKGSVRHFNGQEITAAQADDVGSSYVPGTSYLLTVRQLIKALDARLLPPPDHHPVLWQELRHLQALLVATFGAQNFTKKSKATKTKKAS